MIILLEGADGTGKTTLSDKLVAKLNASYVHLTWNRELDARMLEYQTEALIEAYEFVNRTGQPVIMDRHWLSESIYAQVYRNGPKMPYFGRMVEQFLKSIGGFTICCLSTNIEKHAARFAKLKEERKEMYDNVTNIVCLYNTFYFGDPASSVWPKMHPGYLKEVMANGGARFIGGMLHQYFKYEIEEEGQNIDEYVEHVKEELEVRTRRKF